MSSATYTSFFQTEANLRYETENATGWVSACAARANPSNHFNLTGGAGLLAGYVYLNECFEHISHRFVFTLPNAEYGSVSCPTFCTGYLVSSDQSEQNRIQKRTW